MPAAGNGSVHVVGDILPQVILRVHVGVVVIVDRGFGALGVLVGVARLIQHHADIVAAPAVGKARLDGQQPAGMHALHRLAELRHSLLDLRLIAEQFKARAGHIGDEVLGKRLGDQLRDPADQLVSLNVAKGLVVLPQAGHGNDAHHAAPVRIDQLPQQFLAAGNEIADQRQAGELVALEVARLAVDAALRHAVAQRHAVVGRAEGLPHSPASGLVSVNGGQVDHGHALVKVPRLAADVAEGAGEVGGAALQGAFLQGSAAGLHALPGLRLRHTAAHSQQLVICDAEGVFLAEGGAHGGGEGADDPIPRVAPVVIVVDGQIVQIADDDHDRLFHIRFAAGAQIIQAAQAGQRVVGQPVAGLLQGVQLPEADLVHDIIDQQRGAEELHRVHGVAPAGARILDGVA